MESSEHFYCPTKLPTFWKSVILKYTSRSLPDNSLASVSILVMVPPFSFYLINPKSLNEWLFHLQGSGQSGGHVPFVNPDTREDLPFLSSYSLDSSSWNKISLFEYLRYHWRSVICALRKIPQERKSFPRRYLQLRQSSPLKRWNATCSFGFYWFIFIYGRHPPHQ